MIEAARALVGTPFRLCGRNPATGLDCAGLIGAALARLDRPLALPARYTLRSEQPPDAGSILAAAGLHPALGKPAPGDIAMVRTCTCQYHFLIHSAPDSNIAIHAHAGLRRIVEGPLPASWRQLGAWRLPSLSS
ncbi:NlpC/P60 family protein [Novosphingobium sp. BW1]|nr:NlpC/P60 family protein [Novosphingobium sp. BW1]